MNAANRKKERTSTAGLIASLIPLPGGGWRRALVGIALIVVPIGGAYYAWARWGPQIASGEDYVLKAESVQVTTPPSWVRADVRAEVIRDGGLTGLSLLDPQLTVKVAQAFSAHSWVENVSRVSKHPKARVVVELTYRKPVAMVEVVLNNQPGLLPIDADATLLPPQDFTAEQTRDYLRIAVPDAIPTGPVGTAWGQGNVHEAARIAAVFQDEWKKCGLYRIQLVPGATADSTRIQPTFELQSRNGATVIWGRAPDLRSETDRKAALDKVAMVLRYVEENGSLESASPTTVLDVRLPQNEPRTAQHASTFQ